MQELVPDFIKEFCIYLMTERNLKQAISTGRMSLTQVCPTLTNLGYTPKLSNPLERPNILHCPAPHV